MNSTSKNSELKRQIQRKHKYPIGQRVTKRARRKIAPGIQAMGYTETVEQIASCPACSKKHNDWIEYEYSYCPYCGSKLPDHTR